MKRITPMGIRSIDAAHVIQQALGLVLAALQSTSIHNYFSTPIHLNTYELGYTECSQTRP
ncbi:hypothetical protein BDA96_09G187900 [Sorghum bicolor]|uniref:Uncharacterized protein n=1 Tax=Sorghum bicolor TaxID=4558 RepID=A0A921QBB6_SORBI|nr:hypothetical protein BDA96_09G187900 [Sorghum bicolor]